MYVLQPLIELSMKGVFEITLDDENSWKFYAPGKAEYEKWTTTLSYALKALKLQMLLEQDEGSLGSDNNDPHTSSASGDGSRAGTRGETTKKSATVKQSPGKGTTPLIHFLINGRRYNYFGTVWEARPCCKRRHKTASRHRE